MKKHWYALTFLTQKDGKLACSGVYRAQKYKEITKPDITDAKYSLELSTDSIVINCTYLGYMAEKVFTEGHSVKR